MVKVLFVAGWLRSGTTVTGNVLGSAAGAVNIGELNYLWMKVHPAGFECGCGKLLWDCPLWQPTLSRLGIDQARRYEIRQLRRDSWRNDDTPRRFWEWRRGRVDLTYPHVLGELYAAVAEQAEAAVVVDTTKNVSDALAAALAPDVDLHLLHVVRDPRAAAYSSMQQKSHGSDGQGIAMKQISPARNTFHWDVRNTLIERCAKPAVPADRYLRVRYEDLMDQPQEAFGAVAAWAGLDPAGLPFTAPSTVRVAASHSVMGNPNRHDVDRELTLRRDTRWVERLPDRHARTATALAAPLLRRYGYPLRRPGA